VTRGTSEDEESTAVADNSLGRLLTLSDGVFAIAMTLLALDLHPNGATGASWQELLAALAPKLKAYAISFAVVAIFWISQRRSFARYVRVDAVLVWLSLMFLALVCLLPAATDLMYTINGNGPAFLYVGLILLISFIQAIGWGYAAFIGKLVAADVTITGRVYLFVMALLAPTVFTAVSFLGVMLHGSMSALSWVVLIGLLVTLRFVSRRLFNQTKEPPAARG
jgi:uncharacterized membrane protein